MEMDRSKQRKFKILIFIDSSLVITLNVDFILKTEEDQTEQKLFIINHLKQVFDCNHFKCEFSVKRKLPDQS